MVVTVAGMTTEVSAVNANIPRGIRVTFAPISNVVIYGNSCCSSVGSLPACDLSTRMPLAPARRLIDAGATVAIASNLNPGTSYTSSMNFCVTTAVLQQHLSLDEAIAAGTHGGAVALRRQNVGDGRDSQGRPAVGTLVEGAAANLHVLRSATAIDLAYRPGMPVTAATYLAGERVA